MSALRDESPPPVLEQLRAARRGHAYPAAALAVLGAAGWLAPQPFDADRLARRLVCAGRGDLAAARLYEGHVNALHLVERFADTGVREAVRGLARRSGLGGVWAASDPSDPARLDAEGRLAGRLGFCSGAAHLAFALVALNGPDDTRSLHLIEPASLADRFDPAAWRTTGMQATCSAALRLDGLTLESPALGAQIGPADAYLAEPFFSTGAIRFAAAQTGGLIAVYDALRTHLQTTGRWRAEMQAARLSTAGAACEAAYTAVTSAFSAAAPAIDPGAASPPGDPAGYTALADGARQAVLNAAPSVIETALAGVGASGLFEDHPLSAAVADLQMYLRQPGPDAARRRHGEAVAQDQLRLAFDRAEP